MRIPLRLPHDPETAAVRIALGFVTTGRPAGFAPRGLLRGLRLVGFDLDWSCGEGAEVRGGGIDLLRASGGRAAVLTLLEGPGSQPLADRLDPAAR